MGIGDDGDWLAAGFSLPSPVLAPLLLDPAQGMLTPEASDWSRKVAGVIMGLIRCFNWWGPWLGKLSDRHGRKPVLTPVWWACWWATP